MPNTIALASPKVRANSSLSAVIHQAPQYVQKCRCWQHPLRGRYQPAGPEQGCPHEIPAMPLLVQIGQVNTSFTITPELITLFDTFRAKVESHYQSDFIAVF